MKRLIIHSDAAAEFEEAVTYHEAESEGVGRELRVEIERAFVRLLASPQICPPHGHNGYRKCFVARFRYTIFFLELPEVIWVAAVAHGSRRPGYWGDRLPNE